MGATSKQGSEKRGVLKRVWRVARWPLGILFVLYVALVIYRIPHAMEVQKTQEAVARIHAARLTMDDVSGMHLPPQPDPALVDATVEGIDANDNGIRDDVELAIFKKYPGDANKKIRAAELQYAKALQLYLTSEVFNSDTWKAVVFEDSRGYACISETYPRSDIVAHSKTVDQRTEEVEQLVFDNVSRKNKHEQADEFTTSFGLANDGFCDVSV